MSVIDIDGTSTMEDVEILKRAILDQRRLYEEMLSAHGYKFTRTQIQPPEQEPEWVELARAMKVRGLLHGKPKLQAKYEQWMRRPTFSANKTMTRPGATVNAKENRRRVYEHLASETLGVPVVVRLVHGLAADKIAGKAYYNRMGDPLIDLDDSLSATTDPTDIATLAHEIGHHFRRDPDNDATYLAAERGADAWEEALQADWRRTDALAAAEEWVQNNPPEWVEAVHEADKLKESIRQALAKSRRHTNAYLR